MVVEVLFSNGEGPEAREAIRDAGGTPDGAVPGELVQAEVPISGLVSLESDPAVEFVRPPLTYNEPVREQSSEDPLSPSLLGVGNYIGEQILKTNADAWHEAYRGTGAGVKVGIIDAFGRNYYTRAYTDGEIPWYSGALCKIEGTTCDIFNPYSQPEPYSGSRHGVGVAEVVTDMAPDVQLYLGSANTATDMREVLEYFAAQGVDIVTRSETGKYDGPGDGTGTIATVIQKYAVDNGMFYLNAAGNAAGRDGKKAAHYENVFTDNDGDKWHEFVDLGNSFFSDQLETMEWNCHYTNGLRWDDFGEGSYTTDYDLFIFKDRAATQLISSSSNSQGEGAPPIEDAGCTSGANGVKLDVPVYLKIRRRNNPGDSRDTLEFGTNGYSVEYPVNRGSAAGPMSDLNSPGAVSVGAIDPPNGITIAKYSSEGPTWDGRIKPDLSAAACLSTTAYLDTMGESGYTPRCFNGTSSATPVVAGAAALVLGRGEADSPQTLKDFLLNATVDRGVAGPDNVYGKGELLLPDPDITMPVVTIDAGPTAGVTTNDDSPSFSFSSNEPRSTFRCSLDNDTDWPPCSSPITYRNLADGNHVFRVVTLDPAGNGSYSADRSFGIDATPPETTIESSPNSLTSNDSPTFEFSASDPPNRNPRFTFFGGLNGNSGSLTSPKTYSNLPDGNYVFRVVAKDPAGNVDPTPAGWAFTIDTTAPDTTIDSGPSGPTNDPTPTFEFSSEANAAFECRVDGGSFSACSNPATLGTLADGPHTFSVKSIDSASNEDPTPATRTFTVDTTPPDTTINTGPTGTIATNQATFTFAGDPASDTAKIQCRIDGEPFADCASPKTFTGLSEGPHTAEFRAEDAAGNQDPTPASRTFTVDTTPPDTTIDSGPTGPTSDPTPTFEFSSEPGATFECRVDSRCLLLLLKPGDPGHTACGSPYLRGESYRHGRQHRYLPGHPHLHRRHNTPRHHDRHRPHRHHRNQPGHLHLRRRHGLRHRQDPVPDRRRAVRRLRLAEDLHRPQRRPPHRHLQSRRRSRKPGPDPGHKILHRRHNPPRHHDQHRPHRHHRNQPGHLHLRRRPGLRHRKDPVPDRRRAVRRLLIAQDLHRPQRRPPHSRVPSRGRSRKPGPDPRPRGPSRSTQHPPTPRSTQAPPARPATRLRPSSSLPSRAQPLSAG